MQLGFVGVGTMGVPIVGHLVAAGHTVKAFDLSADALAKAQAAGAQAAGSVGEAAAGAQAVFVAVSNQDVLGEVLRQPGGIFECAAPGAIVVDLGTTAPPRCRAFAAEARARGHGLRGRPAERLHAVGAGRHAGRHGRRRAGRLGHRAAAAADLRRQHFSSGSGRQRADRQAVPPARLHGHADGPERSRGAGRALRHRRRTSSWTCWAPACHRGT